MRTKLKAIKVAGIYGRVDAIPAKELQVDDVIVLSYADKAKIYNIEQTEYKGKLIYNVYSKINHNGIYEGKQYIRHYGANRLVPIQINKEIK